MMTPEESRRRSNGWTYDAELGWVHCSAAHPNGVDGSTTFYHYESDGARKVTNSRDRSSRVHTYGDSFTHCDQVNDGETWQEYLAAHLQEPIRNYGVGGYSVYQAYRRMLRVEKQRPAPFMILNIYDDDHFRNLDAWRSIRAGPRSNCGFTLPHLRVDVARGRAEQRENILRTREAVARLRDEAFLTEAFKDDPVLRLMLAMRAGDQADAAQLQEVADGFGVPLETLEPGTPTEQLRQVHTMASLFATRQVVTWFEEHTARTGTKLMVILSFSRNRLVDDLAGRPRFDRQFAEWMRTKPYPVIDMREAFAQAFRATKEDVSTFVARYYNGHHTPAGNFFTAWAIKDPVVNWLDTAPLPYQPLRAQATTPRDL